MPMRDILLAAIVFGLLPLILRSPRLGAYAWAWISIMNPHRSAFGFAYNFPFASLIALTTLVSFLFSTKERKPFPVTNITVIYLLFIFWMSVTSLFAINTPEVLDRWVFVHKLHLMLLVTLMLIRGRDQTEKLVWVVTASIGFYGVKGGVWTVLTGGSGRVWGPPSSMIEDNNGLGLALVILIPFVYYLYRISSRRLVRIGLAFSGVAMCFSILGSQSRGAFLALLAMTLMLTLKSARPVLSGLLLTALLSFAIIFMPESWTNRMDTIQTYDQDSSAMQRIYTWTTLWNLALDRPVVGAGFATDTPLVFAMYAPDRGESGITPVAHSIYFQALGEHGFPGLILYISLGIVTWLKAGQLARRTRNDPEFEAWVPMLMHMAQVSLLGFAVGGAFLTLVHFDLPYYIIVFVILVDATVRERDKNRQSLNSEALTARQTQSLRSS